MHLYLLLDARVQKFLVCGLDIIFIDLIVSHYTTM
jgi:hypothetical protein